MLQQKNMGWKYISPNKPIPVSENFVHDLSKDYIADVKIDGYRTIISKFDNHINFLSKNNKNLKVPNELLKKFANLPDGTELDAEWINPSRIKCINKEHNTNLPLSNLIIVFDVRWHNYKYLSKTDLKTRRKIKCYSSLPQMTFKSVMNKNMTVFRVLSSNDIIDLYLKTKTEIIYEGVVIKNLNGGLKSSWYKLKYR